MTTDLAKRLRQFTHRFNNDLLNDDFADMDVSLLNEAAAALEGVRVPREPTQEQRIAAISVMVKWRSMEHEMKGTIGSDAFLNEIYRAMLAAAPKGSE